jgi:hypothetical protein
MLIIQSGVDVKQTQARLLFVRLDTEIASGSIKKSNFQITEFFQ